MDDNKRLVARNVCGALYDNQRRFDIDRVCCDFYFLSLTEFFGNVCDRYVDATFPVYLWGSADIT